MTLRICSKYDFKQGNNDMTLSDKGRQKKETGFTLVEVMIAIVVFSIGFFAVAAMQTKAVNTNAGAFNITEATNLAETKMEELMILSFVDPDLTDTDGDGDATVEDADSDGDDDDDDDGDPDDDDADGDGGNFGLDDTGAPGGPPGADRQQVMLNSYTVSWNIADSVPATNTKTIKVIVTWNGPGALNRVDIVSVKSPM